MCSYVSLITELKHLKSQDILVKIGDQLFFWGGVSLFGLSLKGLPFNVIFIYLI